MNWHSSAILITKLSSILLAVACSQHVNMTAIKKEHTAVSADLRAHSDGFSIDDTPLASALLDRKWSLEAAWVVAYLNGHPSATADQVKAAISELGLDSDSILLDKGMYGITTREGEIGNAFLIAADGKRFKVVWNAKDSMRSTIPKSKLLEAWSAKAAQSQCRAHKTDKDWLTCGPVYGSFNRIPDDRMKRRRFYLSAIYAEFAGLNAEAQLSIWTWDGSILQPQFIDDYVFYIDQPKGTEADGMQPDGESLRFRVRDQYRTFSTCCDDEGRPMDWKLKVTPTGIEDLGKRPVVSELETIDELFCRVAQDKLTDDIADPRVRSRVRTLIRQMPKKDGLPSLGTLEYSNAKPAGSLTEFCFEADYSLLFTLKKLQGKPYLMSMKQLDYCPAAAPSK
jgi:hypothetical protein